MGRAVIGGGGCPEVSLKSLAIARYLDLELSTFSLLLADAATITVPPVSTAFSHAARRLSDRRSPPTNRRDRYSITRSADPAFRRGGRDRGAEGQWRGQSQGFLPARPRSAHNPAPR